jgi:ion channel POLLUX/CASTOR
VQTARQNSLAQVYRDLLSYEGSEFYFKAFPELNGRPFGEAQWKMKDGVVVGVRRPVPGGRGQTMLNPPDDLYLASHDELLVLAEDDDTFSLTANHAPQISGNFRPPQPLPKTPDRLLICGMSQKLADMLKEYDNYVLQGSEAWVMTGGDEEAFNTFVADQVGRLQRLSVRFAAGDPTLPEEVRTVAAAQPWTATLVVAQDGLEPDEADARTVISVLLLRDYFKTAGGEAPRIISEILDARTKDLLEQDVGADFVVSNEMTSMLLAQVSERRDLNAVFADLFDSDGNEIYLKRAECYAVVGEPTPWISVLKMARQRKEIALGYARLNQSPILNPKQTETLVFAAGDRVVVVSEDDREVMAEAPVMSEETSPVAQTVIQERTPLPTHAMVTDPGVPAHAAQTMISPGGKPVPRLAPPPGVKIPTGKTGVEPKLDPRTLQAERATTGGGRVPGPSQLPRTPLPPKKS